jgi:hypothetical protein
MKTKIWVAATLGCAWFYTAPAMAMLDTGAEEVDLTTRPIWVQAHLFPEEMREHIVIQIGHDQIKCELEGRGIGVSQDIKQIKASDPFGADGPCMHTFDPEDGIYVHFFDKRINKKIGSTGCGSREGGIEFIPNAYYIINATYSESADWGRLNSCRGCAVTVTTKTDTDDI